MIFSLLNSASIQNQKLSNAMKAIKHTRSSLYRKSDTQTCAHMNYPVFEKCKLSRRKNDHPYSLSDGVSGAASVSSSEADKPRTPAPDLPSLLLENRIVYVGMPLVPAVAELIIAELLYLQYRENKKPIFMYINSTGCTRADGETVGFETEGTAIYDTMQYVKNDVYSVGVGLAYGQACMLLSAGTKGMRCMLPHATAMLHQPRVPPTGQRQAIEIEKKWREVAAQRDDFVLILCKKTGNTEDKLWSDMQRPLYMQPNDALKYGIIDRVIKSQKEGTPLIEKAMSGSMYDRAAGILPMEK